MYVWMSMCVCVCLRVCVWCVTTAIFFSSPNILSFYSYVRRTLYPFITISHVHKTEDINITKYSVFILSSKVLSVSVCACVCVCSYRKAFSFHPWNKQILYFFLNGGVGGGGGPQIIYFCECAWYSYVSQFYININVQFYTKSAPCAG